MSRLVSLMLFFFLFSSCRKNINDNSYLLNFSINNAFVLNNSDTFLLSNGYYSDSAENYLFQPSSNILLNDGQIGDTLLISCGNWSYIQNPTATIEIWFPYFDIENGIYNFDQTSSVNDFSISVKSNLIFDSLASNSYNIISSFNTLASSNLSGFSNSFSYSVNTAILKVENVDNLNSSVKYHVEMVNGNIIKGAYIGQLEKFKYRSIEGDCD